MGMPTWRRSAGPLPVGDRGGVHERYTIVRVEAENYRTKTLVLDRPLKAGPGQFAMVWLPGVGEKPFSIAADDPLALTVVAVGPFSEAIHRLVPGDAVWVRGPLGQGVHPSRGPYYGASVVGGRGVWRGATAVPGTAGDCGGVWRGCMHRGKDGGRRAAETAVRGLGRRNGRRTATGTGVTTRVTTEDGTLGARGLVTEAVGAAVAQARPDVVYACGPVGMLELSNVNAMTWGYHTSSRGKPSCGAGWACAVRAKGTGAKVGWLVCHDGPVDRGWTLREPCRRTEE